MSITNLMNMSGVEQTRRFKNLVLNKKSESYPVYKIPLEYLYYNDKNDRISTEVSRYTSEVGEFPTIREEYNHIFEKMIVESNPERLRHTKISIEKRGQDNPGVVLKDGRVVDGNRRFTCLRLIKEETGIDPYFEAVILSEDYDDKYEYKYIKSLELELQMGVDKPVDYDPIDRLFGIYKNITIEGLYTPDEYAAMFDNLTVADVRKRLGIADVMCRYLEFIGAPGKYYIAKDLKLDGVLNEIPPVLRRVEKEYPELLDETEALIFSAITRGVYSKLHYFVRDVREILNEGDYPNFLKEAQSFINGTVDEIENSEVSTSKDVVKMRLDEDTNDSITDIIEVHKRKIK